MPRPWGCSRGSLLLARAAGRSDVYRELAARHSGRGRGWVIRDIRARVYPTSSSF
ncbi:hypothetical protein HMPREF1980_00642 [Actinomyces sp. oral taxon 172 str. F0311]|nr:hypothetical protein HMPREF1980_00642 [Actinomyces sp. oral taxon 172 str. F0311]